MPFFTRVKNMQNHHYYSENQGNLKSNPNSYTFNYKNQKFVFTSDSGVFSKKYIDFGSYTLIDSFEPKLTEATLLDVGCGYGPIGITVGTIYSNLRVTMIDINERAVSLAQKNIVTNKAQNVNVFKSNIYSEVPEEQKFDYILTNPPIRAGKKVIYEIYDGAFKRLSENGELWVVIQKKQGAPSTIKHLEDVFGNCSVVSKEKGYFILKSVRTHIDK